ncbi:ABC transporter permease [Acetobacterium woodii]|uniref:ABC transporter permease n=1 Tax=Acetobacterium woodii TaxID=33952 RepID=UPI00145E6678|nr:iron ABC transporter permease [Acetobacterium woodii]
MAVVILLLGTIAPVIYLAIGFGNALLQQKELLFFSFNSSLFVSSLAITLGATVLCAFLGLLVAIGIWFACPGSADKIAIILLTLILMPAFIQVQSWIFFADAIAEVINGLMGTVFNFKGVFAVILTMAFASLPVSAGLTLVSLLSIPPEIQDMVRLDGPGQKAFLKIYMPYLQPALVVGSLFVFLVNINDYGITSVFGVNSYALELFSQFSAGMTVYEVFYNGLPLLAVCLAVLAVFSRYILKSDFSLGMTVGFNPFRESKLMILLAIVGLMITGLFILVPLGNLIYAASECTDIWGVLSDSFAEIFYGMLVSVLAAGVSSIPAMLFAGLFYRSKAGYWVLGLAAVPFMIPGPVLGLSLIRMWNTPLLSIVYRSSLMPVVALVAKYTFIEAIIFSVAMASLDRSLLDNIQVHWPGLVKSIICIAQLSGRKWLAAMLIVFALSMGEFGVTLLIMPPGYQTLTIKIYNYLHYGSSDVVAVLCLFMVFIISLVLIVLFKLLGGGKNG